MERSFIKYLSSLYKPLKLQSVQEPPPAAEQPMLLKALNSKARLSLAAF